MSLHHLHPMLVHFPIALTIVALLFDLVGYRFRKGSFDKTAVILTVLATLGAIASLFSGFFFTNPVAGMAETVKEVHMTYALFSTALLIAASVVGAIAVLKYDRRNKLQYLFTLLLLLAVIGISLTGMKGGIIVYDIWLF